jgi:hypothetical protein
VRSRALLWILLPLLAAPACVDPPTSEGVEFCIPMEPGLPDTAVAHVVIDYGRFSAEARPTAADVRRFLVSTESPLTVVNAAALPAAPAGDATSLQRITLAVVDADSSLVVGRAAFWDVAALVGTLPALGAGAAAATFDGLLGGDLLRQYAVRIVYAADPGCVLAWLPGAPTWPSISFFVEWPDTAEELAGDGFAVVPYTLAGGGAAMIADRQFELVATRVTVPLCVEAPAFDPDDPAIATANDVPIGGVDAYGLVATGVQPVVLGRAFFERLAAHRRSVDPGWPAGGLGSTTLFLPEGPVPGEALGLSRIAVVSNARAGESPCAELRRRRRVEWAVRHGAGVAEVPERGETAAAVVELDTDRAASPAGAVAAVVIPDERPTLTSLQAEVTGQVPSVDLLLGAAFLGRLETLIDYPGSRVVLRCLDYTPPEGTSAECPDDATLVAAGQSCCRYGDACRCPATACCQSYRWPGE